MLGKRSSSSARAVWIWSLACVGVAVSHAAARPCEPDWQPLFPSGFQGGPVLALTTFDPDGDGPQGDSLYAVVAPTFEVRRPGAPQGFQIGPVRRWNGRGWDLVGNDVFSEVGSREIPTRASIVPFDRDGAGPLPATLVVVGPDIVTLVESVPNRTGAWLDGETWRPIIADGSSSSTAYDAEVFSGELWIGGEFYGPESQYAISRWNGEDVAEFPLVGRVNDLQSWDADGDGSAPAVLVIGGAFGPLENEPGPRNIAIWDGTNLLEVPSNVGEFGIVNALGVYDTDQDGPGPTELYVALQRLGAESLSVVIYNGESWRVLAISPDDYGFSGPVFGRFWEHDDDGTGPIKSALYFSSRNRPPDGQLSRWDGITLTAVGGPDPLAPNGITGGPAGAVFGSGSPRASGLVEAMATFDLDGDGPRPTELIVGGGFAAATMPPLAISPEGTEPACVNEVTSWFLAGWNGAEWTGLSRGLSSVPRWIPLVYSITPVDPDPNDGEPGWLYVHGNFATAGSVPIARVAGTGYFPSTSIDWGLNGSNARWSATRGWERAGLDLEISPRTIERAIETTCRFDPDGEGPASEALHIGGSFDMIDGVIAGPLARWNSGAQTWENFGSLDSPSAAVYDMVRWDPDGEGPRAAELFVAGNFRSVTFNGVTAHGSVVSWNGERWASTGFELAQVWFDARGLVVHDADGPGGQPSMLVAHGWFDFAASNGLARGIAAYDGVAWSRVGDGAFSVPGSNSLIVGTAASFDEDGDGPLPPTLFSAAYRLQWTPQGGSPIPMNGLARLEGASWVSAGLQEGNCDPIVNDLIEYDVDGPGLKPRALVATGSFQIPSGEDTAIAALVADQWELLGSGLRMGEELDLAIFLGASGCRVRPPDPGHGVRLAVFDDDGAGPNQEGLFVGGLFTTAGGHSSWGFAKWGCTLTSPAPCIGDADGNASVNFLDVTTVLANFGTASEQAGGLGDADGDGAVSFADITAVLCHFGAECER